MEGTTQYPKQAGMQYMPEYELIIQMTWTEIRLFEASEFVMKNVIKKVTDLDLTCLYFNRCGR